MPKFVPILAVDDVTRSVHKGRGAVSNLQGRHEVHGRAQFDDGWGTLAEHGDEHGQQQIETEVTFETARSILSRNTSPDLPFRVSLNPYRGCEHGCIYCYARPSHANLGWSPGLDFETRIVAKTNAAQVLRQTLARRQYVPETIAIGVNTDAYQPCERKLGITRSVLEVLHECQHPVAMITKSSLIERDIDLLAPMAERGLAIAAITLTTLDNTIARALEPRANAPARRLRTIRTLAQAGIPVGVSIAPVIPFITEPDLERVLEAAFEAGAHSASYVTLRLPLEVSPLFQQWLETHFPDRAKRVMNRVREMHGGKDYASDFANRMRGAGIYSDLIRQRFNKARHRLGMDARHDDFATHDCSAFKPPRTVPSTSPTEPASASGQGDLFPDG